MQRVQMPPERQSTQYRCLPHKQMAMTRYQTITALGDSFLTLMGKGIIPVHLLDWKVYYEAYVKELSDQRKSFKRVTKSNVAATVALHYNMSERMLFKIIAFMEND